MLAAKRQEEICKRRYLKRLRNQNEEHLVNIYESNDPEKHKSYSLSPELYFLVQSTDNMN